MFGITQREVWRDEHSTWWAAQLPFDQLWQLLSNIDVVLAPYYLFMRGWLLLAGDSALALRLPSALGMALCASLTAALGVRLFRPRVGMVAGLLFGLLPSISRFGQEARPYAFTLCAALLTTLALWRALEQPERGTRWLAYGASIVLLGSLHLVALCLLLPHALMLGSKQRPRAPG